MQVGAAFSCSRALSTVFALPLNEVQQNVDVSSQVKEGFQMADTRIFREDGTISAGELFAPRFVLTTFDATQDVDLNLVYNLLFWQKDCISREIATQGCV